jgi:hypothetical protein
VHGLTLATVTSDNSPHGSNLTYAFPMILFIVIGGLLYLLYTRPHKVPGHARLRLSGDVGHAGGDTARAAATAAGLSTAAGGGAMESVHEAPGAHRAASAPEPSGNVSQDVNQAAAAGPEPGETSTPASSSTADSFATEDEASE